jgi:hypothetical protein
MKIKQKKKTQRTFGDFIAAAYQKWGASRAANMVQLAINARQVVFQKPRAAYSMGRIKIVPKIALLAVLLGCASFANGSYGAEVIIGVPTPPIFVPPPIIVQPDPGFYLFGGYGPYDGRRDARDYGRRGADSRRDAHRGGGERRR